MVATILDLIDAPEAELIAAGWRELPNEYWSDPVAGARYGVVAALQIVLGRKEVLAWDI